MAIKVKAKETLQTIGTYAGQHRFVMSTEIYNRLGESKVISEAALRSGINKGVLAAAWEAIGDVVSAWAVEGHSVAIPGLGSMRFGVRAKSVGTVEEVGTGLITSRRVIFTPSTAIKDELASTAVNITCYDRNGNIVKRVTSSDTGDVEDPEQEETPSDNGGAGGSSSGSSENPGTGGDGGEDEPIV